MKPPDLYYLPKHSLNLFFYSRSVKQPRCDPARAFFIGQSMIELDSRKMMSAATATTATAESLMPGGASSNKRAKPLSPAALKVAAQPIATAWSPIVVAGVVRMHRIYTHGGRRPCGVRSLCRSGRRLRMALRRRDLRHRHAGAAGVPGGRRLPGAGLPRLREAVLPAGLRVVGRFPAGDRRDVLRQGRSGIFPRVARHVLRRRSDRAGRFPARAVSAGAPMDARGPARPAHRGGRRRRTRQCADQIARVAERFRHPHRRRVRRSRRRALPRLGSPAVRSSAPWTILSNSHAARASIW